MADGQAVGNFLSGIASGLQTLGNRKYREQQEEEQRKYREAQWTKQREYYEQQQEAARVQRIEDKKQWDQWKTEQKVKADAEAEQKRQESVGNIAQQADAFFASRVQQGLMTPEDVQRAKQHIASQKDVDAAWDTMRSWMEKSKPQKPKEPSKPTERDLKTAALAKATELYNADVQQGAQPLKAVFNALQNFGEYDRGYLRKNLREWAPQAWWESTERPEYNEILEDKVRKKELITPERKEGGFLGIGATTIPPDTTSFNEYLQRNPEYRMETGGQTQQPDALDLELMQLEQLVKDLERQVSGNAP
jgi:hypothetical protein